MITDTCNCESAKIDDISQSDLSVTILDHNPQTISLGLSIDASYNKFLNASVCVPLKLVEISETHLLTILGPDSFKVLIEDMSFDD